MISVIIPTLNEAEYLASLLDSLARQKSDHQLLVVDGGSTDGTQNIAHKYSAEFVMSAKGRGQQLKAGAEFARGDILLFLHADSQFPSSGLAAIEKHIGDQANCVGGNFRLIFDGDTGFSRWLTKFYAWIRKRGVYYGDSGVFVRRGIYDKIGGIKAMALMEDFNFNRRMEKAGPTCCIIEPALITSSRKFEGRRSSAIIWGWLKIHALYYLRISPEKLAQYYYRNG
ncbi:MAG: TIGR04283 family arsenosugar biosynthesis glycosyltransferase [Rhodospirillales bacterium]